MTLPPTRTIEGFIAAARLGSLAAAAVELGMSVSALSRRLSALEGALGARLLDRTSTGVVVTGAGSAYLRHAVAALDRLRAAADEVARDRRVVRVTTIPAFATRWLIPRLPLFTARHPGIHVEVRTSTTYEKMDAGAFDVAVRLARDDRMDGPPLLPIHVLPVWSAAHGLAIEQPADVPRYDLLGPDHRPEFWREWLDHAGVEAPAEGVRGVDPLILYDSALAGAGVAIGIEPLVDDLLRQGRLVGLTQWRRRSARSFFLLRGAPSAPAGRLFETWLRETCRDAAADPPRDKARATGPAS